MNGVELVRRCLYRKPNVRLRPPYRVDSLGSAGLIGKTGAWMARDCIRQLSQMDNYGQGWGVA